MSARRTGILGPVALAAALLLSACGGGSAEDGMGGPAAGGQAGGGGGGGGQSVVVADPLAHPLTDTEKAHLAYMREEERLAHDVYIANARLWGVPVFSNIAESEARHTDAVLNLLMAWSQPDPLAGLPEGVFATPAFQSLYDDLATRSALGLVEALTVGAEIEELDIRDIVTLRQEVQHAEILTVLDNLLKGSRNHLRSYVGQLAAQGVTYAPRILSASEYDAIIQSPMERGN